MTKPSPRTTTHQCNCSLGKTFFLNFLLARLISARQVVLLSDGYTVHLFYHGKLYTREPVRFSCLPRHKLGGKWPIWTLIGGNKDQEPPISSTHNI